MAVPVSPDQAAVGLQAILRGIRNGAHYGAKIRAPHALVMTVLFRGGSIRGMAEAIAKLTWEHSKNLAAFVGLYKTATFLLGKLDGDAGMGRPGRPMAGWHAAVAGALGGYLIWGRYSGVK